MRPASVPARVALPLAAVAVLCLRAPARAESALDAFFEGERLIGDKDYPAALAEHPDSVLLKMILTEIGDREHEPE